MDLDEITKEMNVDREELWCIITLKRVWGLKLSSRNVFQESRNDRLYQRPLNEMED